MIARMTARMLHHWPSLHTLRDLMSAAFDDGTREEIGDLEIEDPEWLANG